MRRVDAKCLRNVRPKSNPMSDGRARTKYDAEQVRETRKVRFDKRSGSSGSSSYTTLPARDVPPHLPLRNDADSIEQPAQAETTNTQ